ncbi:MAG: LamG domain-containing protein, partial [Planctomycetaceae bacterium]|nr:LamG domain-containing protein [Planctomycetaceae bacterium]
MRTLIVPLSLLLTLGLTLQSSADLVGHWPLNDGAGAVANNLVDGGADGQIYNAETGGPADGSVWVDDATRGMVIGFGGQAAADTGFVRAGDIPQMTLENDFTWSFWSNTDPEIAANPGKFSGIVGNRYQPGPGRVDYNPRQFIKFTPTAFEWHMNANGNDNVGFGDDALVPGEWVHQAVVKDGESLTYYRDGAETLTGAVTQALDAPMPLWFGGDDAGDATEQWQGLLSDVRTYDHALSAAEVAALLGGSYCATSTADTCYDFDSDEGVAVYGDGEVRAEGGYAGGYLKVTDAANGQRGKVIVPDSGLGGQFVFGGRTGGANAAHHIDNLEASVADGRVDISALLRVGGGTDRPADGFSFNFVKPGDPTLAEDTNGWAGIGGEPNNLPEEGTTTGISIGFDEWQSGPNAQDTGK